MCTLCFEGLGLQLLAATLRHDPAADGLRMVFTEAFQWQEGIEEDGAEAPALPLTRWCLSAEQAWCGDREVALAEEPHPRRLVVPWSPPLRGDLVTPADLARAKEVLCGYAGWCAAIWRAPSAEDGERLERDFPYLWLAWLVVSKLAPVQVRGELGRQLACCSIRLSEEMVDLWLQRRAILAWHDSDGMDALLDAYGVTVRAQLVHYAVLKRGASDQQRQRIRTLAARHADGDAVEWVLG